MERVFDLAEGEMPDIAGRDGQTVFPGDGGDLRVPQVAVLPPVLSLGCFQLGSVAAPLRRGSSIKTHKASSVVLTEELEFRFRSRLALAIAHPFNAVAQLRHCDGG